MSIAPISLQLQSAVDLIHEQTHSRKADAYLLCEETLNQARELHDDAAFIAVAIDYALVIDQQGYPERCINILYEALQLAQSYHSFKEEGRLLILIGRSVYTRAEYSRAIQAWAQALEVSELANDRATWIWAKFGVGQVYDAMEDHVTAIIVLTEAKKRAEALGDKELLMHVIFNLGVNLYREKHYDMALENYQTAQKYSIELEHHDETGELFFRMAEVNFAEGRIELAWKQLDQAEEICTRTHHIWALANIHMTRASIFEYQKQFDAAHQEINEGIIDAIKSGANHVLMRLYFAQSKLAEAENNAKLCLSAFKMATALHVQIYPNDKQQQIKALEDIAGLTASPGKRLLELANNPQLHNSSINQLAQLLCENSIEILNIDQASFWKYEKGVGFNKTYRHSKSATIHSAEKITSQDHPLFVQSLLKSELIIAHNVAHHQLTWPLHADYFLPYIIHSALIIPISVSNEVRGFLCFEHCKNQHNWSTNEVQYANQIAVIAARGIGNIDLSHFVSEIAELNAKLMKNNDDLENRVSERTMELSSAMEHLIQSEKLASLGNLVAGFAHELNTPLGNTLTAASTLLDKNNELLIEINEGKIKKSMIDQYITDTTMIAQLVERNARKASDLICNLKQVAVDTASSKQRKFNLKEIINETLITLGPSLRKTTISINVKIPDNIEFFSYPGSLEQIISNLINNAIIHAFSDKNEAEICIEAIIKNDENIKLIFSDNGAGIAESIKSKIFDPFFTTKFGQGGSGLGLYLVYSLVTGTLGGQLVLESTEGVGSQFIMTLPLCAPEEQALQFDPHRH